MALQDRLDAVKADLETRILPREIVAALHRATADLKASGQAVRALRAGDRAPEFTLQDANGKPARSADYLVRGPLVLTFQRGSWCPYCSMDLRALEEAAVAIKALGASLVVVSPQSASISRKLQLDNDISFPVLRDPGNALAHRFGLRYRISTEMIETYARMELDLLAFNGEDSLTLPIPARYVIRRDGLIAFAEVNPDYTRRPDPREWMPVLYGLQADADV